MSDEAPKSERPGRAQYRYVPLLLILLGFAAFFAFGLDRYVTFEALRANRAALSGLVDEYGVLAAVAFGLVYALMVTVVPPSGAVMTLAGGFMFGWALGGTVVVFGATLGATCLFLAARTAFGDVLRGKAGPSVQRMRAGFERNAASYMLFLRLVPVFPFFLVNLAPAFLGVSLRVYILTTFVGIIPATFIYASLGAGIGDLIEEETLNLGLIFAPRYLLPILGLAALALVPVVIGKFKQSFANRALLRSLSAKLLVLTIAFVMLAEVLIFVPSVAQFRRALLEGHLEKAQLAALVLEATSEETLPPSLEAELLANAMVKAVVLKRGETRTLMLSEKMPPKVDVTFDLRGAAATDLIWDALSTLMRTDNRTINVVGSATLEAGEYVEIILSEQPLRSAMADYGRNIFLLSLAISLITASMVFVVLNLMIARPMGRIVQNLDDFRDNPEDAKRIMTPSDRQDEIGSVERGLHDMEGQVRAALQQKTRLAALGSAVAKINHDLRNILASAQLVSDRLADSDDPDVRKTTPILVRAVNRAVDLCNQTLKYGKAEEPKPRPIDFELAPLVGEIGLSVGLSAGSDIKLHNHVPPEFSLYADPDQLFRALQNLIRNAAEAIGDKGEVTVLAQREGGDAVVDIADTGPGLPDAAQANLFTPFRGSARSGGTGLGLANVLEIVEAHGGTVRLVRTDADGTLFRITLPQPA